MMVDTVLHTRRDEIPASSLLRFIFSIPYRLSQRNHWTSSPSGSIVRQVSQYLYAFDASRSTVAQGRAIEWTWQGKAKPPLSLCTLLVS